MTKQLGEIQTFKFKKKIIIAIAGEWEEIFKDEEPKFQATIDNDGNYVLVGPKVHWPTKRNQIPAEVVSKNE